MMTPLIRYRTLYEFKQRSLGNGIRLASLTSRRLAKVFRIDNLYYMDLRCYTRNFSLLKSTLCSYFHVTIQFM